MVHGREFLGPEQIISPEILVVDHACPKIGVLVLAQLRVDAQEQVGAAVVGEDHGTVATAHKIAVVTKLHIDTFQGSEGNVPPGRKKIEPFAPHGLGQPLARHIVLAHVVAYVPGKDALII